MKKNKITTLLRTVPKSNREIIETERKSLPLKYTYVTVQIPGLA